MALAAVVVMNGGLFLVEEDEEREMMHLRIISSQTLSMEMQCQLQMWDLVECFHWQSLMQ